MFTNFKLILIIILNMIMGQMNNMKLIMDILQQYGDKI